MTNGKRLLICESPGKTAKLRSFLGNEFQVLASMGHVCDLPADELGIDVAGGFKPQWVGVKDKGAVIKRITQAMQKAAAIYLATDPDREGEAIQPDPHVDPTGYAVGVVEVWQDPLTGDQAGSYLHLAEAPHLQRAEETQANIYSLADEAGVSDAAFGDFAHDLIKGRGDWQPLTDAQWQQVDKALAPYSPDFDDDARWAERNHLLAQVFKTIEPQHLPDYDQAVKDLGIQLEGFDPATTPPPLFDAKTNTAYWIGVYQDPETPDQGITSLLSIQMDENDAPQARLAPVAMGDFDHAHRTAEYMLTVAERTQDVAQVLDVAEGMAVATQHRELWDSEQGIPVERDIAFSLVEMEIE